MKLIRLAALSIIVFGVMATAASAGPVSSWCDSRPPIHTPEPSSLILLGSGLIGLAGVAKRKLFSR